jgi:hypothetical protein
MGEYVGTFSQGSPFAHVGTVRYDNGAFWTQTGNWVTPENIAQSDTAGCFAWASPYTQQWFYARWPSLKGTREAPSDPGGTMRTSTAVIIGALILAAAIVVAVVGGVYLYNEGMMERQDDQQRYDIWDTN